MCMCVFGVGGCLMAYGPKKMKINTQKVPIFLLRRRVQRLSEWDGGGSEAPDQLSVGVNTQNRSVQPAQSDTGRRSVYLHKRLGFRYASGLKQPWIEEKKYWKLGFPVSDQ